MWKRSRMPNVPTKVQTETHLHSAHEEETWNFSPRHRETRFIKLNQQTLSVPASKLASPLNLHLIIFMTHKKTLHDTRHERQ